MQTTTYNDLESLFLALGDKTRLRLLGLLTEGEMAVGDLVEQIGESQPKVSRHLAYLRNADVVSARRDGKWIYYCIQQPDNPMLRRILSTVLHSVGGETNLPLQDDNVDNERVLPNIEPDVVERPQEEETEFFEEEHAGDATEMEIFLL
ncbi:MAG: metalloregulator ArsR/SmtB family transcription factor [Pyrinomonadaceae bacterium]